MELSVLRLRGDSVSSSTSSEYTSNNKLNTSRFLQVFKIYCTTHRRSSQLLLLSLLISLAVIAACLLSTPTITFIYYKVITDNSQQQSTSGNTAGNLPPSNNTCTQYGARNESSCTNGMSWSHFTSTNNTFNSTCQIASTTTLGSTFTMCLPFLTTWHQCTLGSTDAMYVSRDTAIPGITREQINQLLAYKSAASQPCQTVLLPFICQLSFPLCSCVNGDLYLPSRETCTSLSTDVCSREWSLVSSINPSVLPDCQLLSEEETNFNQSNYTPSNSASNSTTDTSTNDTTVCSKNFYKLNRTCLPDCVSYDSDRPVLIGALTAAAIILIGCIGVFIIALLQWRQMLKLPAVILLYTTFSCLLFGLVTVFSQIDHTLFCVSKNLIESINNPSIFCKVSGFIVTYCIVSIFSWSVALFVFIFYKLAFRSSEKGPKFDKYLHIIFFILCMLYPLLVALLPTLVTDWEYTMLTFPPSHCTTKSIDYWYYTVILPASVSMGISVCLGLVLIWRWWRQRWIVISPKDIASDDTTTNVKKYILFYCYITLLEAILFIQSMILTISSSTSTYMQGAGNYFLCELFGHERDTSSQCQLPNNDGYIYPLILYYILLGLVPFCIIAVLMNWKALGEKLSGFYNGILNKKQTL